MTNDRTTDMQGKICVITGATNGIGRATALGLARRGAEIVIVARNATKAAAVANEIAAIGGAPVASIVLADLTEMHDVRRAAAEIAARFDRVDVLVNNAAGMFDTCHASSEGIEDAYAVNHLAVFLLTQLLHPSLRRAAAPRVVIVSSNIHEKAPYVADYATLLSPSYQWPKIYGQTKLRNMIFARTLSVLWQADGITVNALHPGVVDTGLMSGWENRGMKAIFGIIQKLFISPEKGALTSIFLAADSSVAGVTGTYFDRCRQRPHNPLADDAGVQQRLWAESLAYLRQAGIDDIGSAADQRFAA